MRFDVIPGGGNVAEKPKDAELVERVKNVLNRVENMALDLLIQEFPNVDREKVQGYLHDYSTEQLQQVQAFGDSDEVFSYTNFPHFLFQREAGIDVSGPTPPSQTELALGLECSETIDQILDKHSVDGFTALSHAEVVSMRLDFIRRSLRTSTERVLNEARASVAVNLAGIFLTQDEPVPNKLRIVLTKKEYDNLVEELKGEKAMASLQRIQDSVLKTLESRDGEREEQLKALTKEIIEDGVSPRIAERREYLAEEQDIREANQTLSTVEGMTSKRLLSAQEIMRAFDDPRDVYNWLVEVSKAEAVVKGVGK